MMVGTRVIAAVIFSLTARSASRVASLPPVIIRSVRSQITADISAPSTHPSIASSGQVLAEDFVGVLVMEDTPAARMLHCNNGGRGGRLRGVARSAARDAVKKEALRKAGIGCHEIVAGHTTPSELRALVEKLVPAG